MKLIRDNKVYIQGYNIKYLIDNDLLNGFDYIDVVNKPFAFFNIGEVNEINLNLVRGVNNLNNILNMSLDDLIKLRDKMLVYDEFKSCDMLVFDYLLKAEDLNIIIYYIEKMVFGSNLLGLKKVKLNQLIELSTTKYLNDGYEINILSSNILDVGKALKIRMKNFKRV